jgi:hypothetical protein
MRGLTAWLGFSYLIALTAGASGVEACVHGAADQGHGLPEHASAPSHSEGAVAAFPLPCAAAESTQHGVEAAPDGEPHDPCDCMANCCAGPGPAGFVPPPTASEDLPSCDAHIFVAVQRTDCRSDQHRLPYPNAPPLL